MHTRKDRRIQTELAFHFQRMPLNRIPLKSYHYRPQDGEQLEDRRNVGESSCNSVDGTDQRVQSLMFMMMLMMMMMGIINHSIAHEETTTENVHSFKLNVKLKWLKTTSMSLLLSHLLESGTCSVLVIRQ
jgi:hypothetical protein